MHIIKNFNRIIKIQSCLINIIIIWLKPEIRLEIYFSLIIYYFETYCKVVEVDKFAQV